MPKGILLKDKQARIVLALKSTQQPWYMSTIVKECGTTYVHAHNFIKTCQEAGIVSVEKHGKIKEVKLTERGIQVADMIAGIYSALNQQQKAQEEKREEKK